MTTDSTHFVKYRMQETAMDAQYLTFSSHAPKPPPVADDHPVIQKLAETDSAAADKALQLIQAMIGQEKTFFAWLGADAMHMALFIKDPITALKQGIPALPDSFYKDLASLPKIYAPESQ